MKKSILALILVCFMLFSSACVPQESGPVADKGNSSVQASQDKDNSSTPVSNDTALKTVLLSEGYSQKAEIKNASLSSGEAKTAADFSYELFKNAYSESGNTLISPTSVMYALAMAQSGADGNTLTQMEDAFGVDRAALNIYLASYLNSVSAEDSSLKLSQSVWVNSKAGVKQEFLQTNADYFNAEIYSSAMGDDTVGDINNWVSDKTDGEIEKIIDELSPTDVFVLINATLFDGKWETTYKDSSVRSGTFYNLNNSKAEVSYLYSSEHTYLSGDGFKGFAKPYAGDRFAFAALLPDEESSLTELVSSLKGSDFANLIKNAQSERVTVSIPEFSLKYDAPLPQMLKNMGITDAFDPDKADFSLASGDDIYISDALHSTSIKLNRHGTKAATATAIIGTRKSADDTEKTVYLNRPFLYVIYDVQADMPVFIGTVTNLS